MYTKFQLAAQYFPESMDNAKVAVRRLIRWMDSCHGLIPALLKAGYHRNQKHFTMRQVEIVYDYLGEP